MRRRIGSFFAIRSFCMAASVIMLVAMCSLWGCGLKEQEAADMEDERLVQEQESSDFQPVPEENSSQEITSEKGIENALPFYRYTGGNGYIKSVCDYFCGLANGDEEQIKLQKQLAYSEGKGTDIVYIPVPVIMKTEEADGRIYLYGTFWDMWYALDGTNLYSLSGGENTGRLELTQENGEFRVTGFEKIRDGGDYAEDWKRLCEEDQTLYHRLFTKEEREDRRDLIRGEMILQYARDNGLDIRSYQDYGWDPVKLPGIANVGMKVRKDSVTPVSLSLTLSNDTDLNIQYGDEYYLEKWEDGAWSRVPYAEESYGFPSIAYNVPKGSPAEIDIDWSILYGDLEPGQYRIVKKISDFRGTGDYDDYDLHAEFAIEAGPGE